MLSKLDGLKEGYESRVKRWLDSNNRYKQCHVGLYTETESRPFRPDFNMDVTWDSNINFVSTDDRAFENTMVLMQTTDRELKNGQMSFTPIYNMETKWKSNINLVSNNGATRLESSLDPDSDYSSNYTQCDERYLSTNYGTNLRKPCVLSDDKIKRTVKATENDINFLDICELPAFKTLYFMEVYGKHCDLGTDPESESEKPDLKPDCGCKCHNNFFIRCPRH